MTTKATHIDYHDGNTICKGIYFTPENSREHLPVVLICHAWDGLVQEVKDKAIKLAESGYIAFAIDVYGNGKTLTDMADMMPTVAPFMADRKVLLKRLRAAVDAAKIIPGADSSKIAAMGYCFGGLCALDLARGGHNDIQSVISFHGSLLPNGIDTPHTIPAKILAIHGHDDPMVPPEQVAAFQQEMTDKKADWQFIAYGHTVHSFTRHDANNPDLGTVYNETADRRSWLTMLNFLTETLQ
ncbi:dienelactone hydrolase family protein [Oceanicoccus sp. KOV_DT_Chl]|uniref:dienelactone hydrolase family protein n=1 Tax=Oceanicoccus sp. KOV_DT_Chl TaxID=1904639 RepID=UPI000C7A78D0|nr:dienelactone hydrolase family protein [Oceanicoccus sp. KOV_DT_Chl]